MINRVLKGISLTPTLSSLFWQRRSFSLVRGFRFDRMFDSTSPDPQETLLQDQMAMMSMKTLAVPRIIKDKLQQLIAEAGDKKLIERMGWYMNRRYRSRANVELPRVLPSRSLPEAVAGHTEMDRLLRSPVFQDLRKHLDLEKDLPDDSEILKLAIAHAEDSRHRLYVRTFTPHTAIGFVMHRYHNVFAVMFRVLFEISKRVPDFQPANMIEFPASAAIGTTVASMLWEDTLAKALCIEPSTYLSAIGRYLTSHIPNVEWMSHMYEATEFIDLAVLPYGLIEIKDQPSRDVLVKQVWNRLSAGGIMVIVEKGTPTGFRMIHSIRELFINELSKENYHFVAPCPHENMCPLSLTGSEWCHFDQKVHGLKTSIFNRRGLKKKKTDDILHEKFSYLIIRKSPGPRVVFESEAQAVGASWKSYFWPRIISPVLQRDKHVLLDVCSAPYYQQRLSVSKSSPQKNGYKISRQLMWGDLFRYPKRVTVPEAKTIKEEQVKLKLEAMAKKANKTMFWSDSIPKSDLMEWNKDEISHFGK